MTTLEILRRARELLATPERWRKSGDKKALINAKCLYLALDGTVDEEDAAIVALGFRGPGEMWAWNDAPERTHAEVLARLDSAIAAEEAKENQR